MKTDIKNIISISIFIFFIIFLIFSIFQFNYMKEKIQAHDSYKNIVEKMRLSNIKLDNQINKKFTLINYDYIVKDVHNFESLQKKLIDSKLNLDSENIIQDIKKEFEKKKVLLEHFKTYNSSIINAIPYLFDIAQAIKKEKILNLDELNLLGKAVVDILKVSVNIDIDKQTLQKNIENILILKEKYNNIKFKILYQNIKVTTKNITILNNILKDYTKIDLDSKLLKLITIIDKEHMIDNKRQEAIMIILFIISTLLLLLSIIAYIKLIKTNQELLSFKYAVENSDNSIVITDTNRIITYVNDAFVKTTGYTKKEALGKNPNILKSNLQSKDIYINMNKTLDQGKKWLGEFINRDKNGDIYYEKASITPIFKHKKLIGYLAIKLDITEYIRQKEKVEFLAHHDILTNLPNRRSFEKQIDICLKDAKSKDSSIAILFIDIDGFKNINDTLGHNIGDILLKSISKKLKYNLDKDDYIFRVGGDEFTIILRLKKNKNIYMSSMVAKRLLDIINQPFHVESNKLRISASIGIAVYPNDAKDAKNLLKYADSAMYKAKLDGKNRFRHYTKKFSQKLLKRLKVEQALLNAIKNREFYVVYQPEYCLHSKDIYGFEALLRWNNKELGVTSPDYFIPIAEQTGIIQDIGKFIFKQVCQDYKHLKQKFDKLEIISINLSPIQLLDINLVNYFKNTLKNYNIKPSNIGLEVTETHIMENIILAKKILKEMNSYGFNILIDDFGTGYSSMNYLKELPINILKIDKSFIDNICHDKNDIKIVKAIIAISDSFNFKIIAEGIETQEQEYIIKELGSNLGQGYLFSKPKKLEYFL